MAFRSDAEIGAGPDTGGEAEPACGGTGSALDPAFRIVARPGSGSRGLSCWMALPRRIAGDAAPLVAVHGIQRGAEAQARAFARAQPRRVAR